MRRTVIALVVVAIYATGIFITRQPVGPEADFAESLSRQQIEAEVWMNAGAERFCQIVTASEGIDIVWAVEADLRLWERRGFGEDDAIAASVTSVSAFCPEQHRRILDALEEAGLIE